MVCGGVWRCCSGVWRWCSGVWRCVVGCSGVLCCLPAALTTYLAFFTPSVLSAPVRLVKPKPGDNFGVWGRATCLFATHHTKTIPGLPDSRPN